MNSRIVLRWMGVVATLVVLVALSGCGAMMVMLTLEPEQRAAMFLVPADKGVIYFYPDEPIDSAAVPAVYLDGDALGGPTAAGFWYREVEPGVHSIELANSSGEKLVIHVEAGRTYFIGEELDCSAGGAPYLHTVDERTGRAHVRALAAERKSQPGESQAPAMECRSTPPADAGIAL